MSETESNLFDGRITIPAGTILLGEYGSGSSGVATAESDRDLAGIVVEEPQFVTGIAPFDIKRQSTAGQGNRSSADDLDVSLYGLRKFAAGVSAGNPNMVLLTYLPSYDILTEVGQFLIDHRHLFLSNHMPKRFLRYLEHQRDALLGVSGARVHRPDLVERFGYDVKFAYHAVRVGLQAHELLDRHRLHLPFTGENLQLLLDIRAGKLTLDEVVTIINDLYNDGFVKLSKSNLPEEPDPTMLNELLHEMYTASWRLAA